MDVRDVMSGPEVDLGDPGLLFREDILAAPQDLYEQLRRRAPVHDLGGTGTFLVSSAAHVAEAVGRVDDFSSNLRSLVFRGDDGGPVVFDMTSLGAATAVLATADGPTHTLHRKLLQPAFSPGAVARTAGFIRAVADELLAPLLRDGRADVATAVAEPLPVRVICRIIGIPEADVEDLAPLVLQSNDLLAGVVDAEVMANAATASVTTAAYLAELLDGWAPADGAEPAICDLLVRARADGTLTTDEAVGILVQLLGAGTETTTSLIARAALQLARDPSLQSRVRAQPDLVPSVVEETLRIDGPFQFHYRAATRDTELGGVAIPEGSRVLLLWASANLDEAVVDRPDQFDIERALLRGHLAFGRGAHFCIGAPLARIEARIVLERLLGSTATFCLDDARPIAVRPSIFLRRLGHLPLLLDPA